MDPGEREIRAKIRAEVEAAKERWAPDVPDHASPYRRGINLALARHRRRPRQATVHPSS